MRALANIMSKIREVRKRDSRVVPFELDKISEAIHRAQLSVGPGDRTYARELADVVEHFLCTEVAGGRDDGIPHIEEIQDVVEKVLMARPDCGEVAKSYILYRRKRELLRETLEVRREKKTPLGGGGRSSAMHGGLPSVEKTDAGVSTWKKASITAALIREADLDPSLAEEVAASVEAKVLRTGILLISTSLIRELVDNELFERGYDAKLKKQAPLSLPKYDMEELIHGGGAGQGRVPREAERRIAREILLQYSLDEVFSPEVARAHRNGRFYVHSLRDPLRCYRIRTALDEAVAGQLTGLQELVSREVRLACGASSALSPDVLSPGAVFEMDCSDTGCLEILGKLLEVARRAETGPSCIIRLSPFAAEEFYPFAGRLLELATAGAAVELLPPVCGEFPGGTAPLIVAGKVTLNLPRAAYRSAREAGASIENELDEIVDLAVKGLLERTSFISRLCSDENSPLAGLRGLSGPGVGGIEQEWAGIVGVVGLNECVSYLSGSQLHEAPEAMDKGLELIERLAEKLRAEQGRLGLKLVLEESRNRGELRRLQELDGRLYPEFVSGLVEAGHLYTDGVRARERDPLDAIEFDVPLLRSVVPRGGVVGAGLDLCELDQRQLSEFVAEALELSSARKRRRLERAEEPSIEELKK